jgi:rhamnosyltransferase
MTMAILEDGSKVSVVILAKNGLKTIGRCLESLFSQKTDFSFDVIVIDSGSTDGTIDLLADYPVELRRIEPSEFNFGETKNLGFSISKSGIVVFLSQDAIPIGNEWLQRMIAPLEDPEVMIAQGHEKAGEGGFYWWVKAPFRYTSEIRRWMERYGQIGLSCVTIAIRRKAWERVKFDKVPFGEDKLFQKKAVEAGLKMVFVQDAAVEHSHDYTLSTVVGRITNEGLGARISGGSYSFGDMVKDLLYIPAYRHLLNGLRNGEIGGMAEFLFPLIRPVFVYKGMNFVKDY